VADQPLFDLNNLEEVFLDIGRRAVAAGKVAEIAVYGGPALLLTFPARVATKDVHAVIEHDKDWLRRVISDIAHEKGWPESWLNEGVKGFLSHRDKDPAVKRLFRTYPSETEAGLRIVLPSPHYLFAMKCMAMRIGGTEQTRDRGDIEMLAQELHVTTAEQAIAIVSDFYPDARIAPRTKFGIEEIFSGSSSSGKREQ
jgi:hypothetical protein